METAARVAPVLHRLGAGDARVTAAHRPGIT
jgi:hypothetical protein